VPAKDVTDARPTDPGPEARFRRPSDEVVRRAARRAVKGGKASFRSQAAFREAVLALLRRDEPLATVGGLRLRRLLVGVPGVHLSVHYTERSTGGPPETCPVCGGELAPIRNRTLTGESVVLGQKCRRCDYWTHGKRRVPVRYLFSAARLDGRPVRR